MVEAWYDPTNHVVSTDKNDPRFTKLGQLWRLVPERGWVGLTDEEGAEIWGDAHDIDWNRLITPKEIVKRIEAKLREKNHD